MSATNFHTDTKEQANLPGADKSLPRPGRKQARKHARDERDFNNIETRAVIKCFFFLPGKALKEIHVTPTETLACFLPGRAIGPGRKQARKHAMGRARFQQHRDASCRQVFLP